MKCLYLKYHFPIIHFYESYRTQTSLFKLHCKTLSIVQKTLSCTMKVFSLSLTWQMKVFSVECDDMSSAKGDSSVEVVTLAGVTVAGRGWGLEVNPIQTRLTACII